MIFLDDSADLAVIQQFDYLYSVDLYNNSNEWEQLVMEYPHKPIVYKEDSSWLFAAIGGGKHFYIT